MLLYTYFISLINNLKQATIFRSHHNRTSKSTREALAKKLQVYQTPAYINLPNNKYGKEVCIIFNLYILKKDYIKIFCL